MRDVYVDLGDVGVEHLVAKPSLVTFRHAILRTKERWRSLRV